MKTAIIIPARFASQRFNGKSLAGITGATGISKTLIQRTWEAASKVPGIARLIVATDDTRIEKAAVDFGAEVMLTSKTARNGTERCAELVNRLKDIDLLVNFQGDAPLTPPHFVTKLIAGIVMSNADMATPVLRCDSLTLNRLRQDRQAGRVGGTTAVFNVTNRALYFSKEIIPYSDGSESQPVPVFHHIGLYAYRPEALQQYLKWPEGVLEQAEGLEQMRFLENAHHVHCVEVEADGREFWEVNNPVDVPRVERALQKQGIV